MTARARRYRSARIKWGRSKSLAGTEPNRIREVMEERGYGSKRLARTMAEAGLPICARTIVFAKQEYPVSDKTKAKLAIFFDMEIAELWPGERRQA